MPKTPMTKTPIERLFECYGVTSLTVDPAGVVYLALIGRRIDVPGLTIAVDAAALDAFLPPVPEDGA